MTDSDSWDDEPTISVTGHAALDALNKERVAIFKSWTANGNWCVCVENGAHLRASCPSDILSMPIFNQPMLIKLIVFVRFSL